MKKDIKTYIKEIKFENKELPTGHREEFYNKLKSRRTTTKSTFSSNYLLKVAAVILLFIALSIIGFNWNNNRAKTIVKSNPIEKQLETIEKEYLASIDKEWQNFLDLAKDENLINRYKSKLDDLDTDYRLISEQFKHDTNNILVIQDLVNNLQTRLQLLKDIQQHIILLNQKNEQYETTNI
jgi:hypothetical protein